jgi:four helix bundle protein
MILEAHMSSKQENGRSAGSLQHVGDLRAWEKSFELAVAIFKIADRIPEGLGLSLNGQMRVTALSVPSYIARAQSNSSARQYLRGLCLARGALTELETHLHLCHELGYASDLDVRRVQVQMKEVGRMTAAIMNRLRSSLGDRSLEELSDQIAALVSDDKRSVAGGRS